MNTSPETAPKFQLDEKQPIMDWELTENDPLAVELRGIDEELGSLVVAKFVRTQLVGSKLARSAFALAA